MDGFAPHLALGQIWQVVADANRYFAGEEPWLKRKTDPDRMATVLGVAAEVLRILAILAQPFVPAAAAKLLDLLEVAADKRDLASIADGPALAPGLALPAPTPIFPRYVEDASEAP